MSHHRSRRAQHHAKTERDHESLPDKPMMEHAMVAKGAHELLASAEGVAEFARQARDCGVVAFDTEFIGEESFRPKICLVQVATGDRVALLDPLSGVDPMPIYQLVADSSVLTLVHAGEQDLMAVRQAIQGNANQVVDTQIAASMVGLPWPSSLGNTIEHYTGFKIDKAHTFTEWDRRPLSNSQLRYAADDVRYLPLLWSHLKEQLTRENRLDWAMQESAAQLAGEPEFDPDRQMRRASRGEPIKSAAKTILRELVLLRRVLAEEEDQPQRSLLPDPALMELVRRKPESVESLGETRFVPKNIAARHGHRIVQCIHNARSMPPIRQEFERLLEDTAVRARIEAMWLAFQTRCMATKIAPNLVTSRAEFTSWLASCIDREHTLAKGAAVASAPAPFAADDWRAQSIGPWLEKFIVGRGELSLRWDATRGGLRLTDES